MGIYYRPEDSPHLFLWSPSSTPGSADMRMTIFAKTTALMGIGGSKKNAQRGSTAGPSSAVDSVAPAGVVPDHLLPDQYVSSSLPPTNKARGLFDSTYTCDLNQWGADHASFDVAASSSRRVAADEGLGDGLRETLDDSTPSRTSVGGGNAHTRAPPKGGRRAHIIPRVFLERSHSDRTRARSFCRRQLDFKNLLGIGAQTLVQTSQNQPKTDQTSVPIS